MAGVGEGGSAVEGGVDCAGLVGAWEGMEWLVVEMRIGD